MLSMLNWIMGGSDFRRAISYFLHQHAFQSVDTHDFENAIMASTGQNLNWFFDQWVYAAGHPVFEVKYQWNESSQKVVLQVDQTQQTSDRVPVFQMPMVIGITTPSGMRSYRVWIRKQEEHFDFPCPQKPLLVRFDEGNHLLKEMTFPKGVEELEFQLRKDDVPWAHVGRVAAIPASG